MNHSREFLLSLAFDMNHPIKWKETDYELLFAYENTSSAMIEEKERHIPVRSVHTTRKKTNVPLNFIN